jgi:NADH dehydrogenase
MSAHHQTRTVCVLGGSGFVGRSLCNQLVRRGYSVRVPTRNPARRRQLLVLPGVDLLPADIHDAAALESMLAGCATVINLVGILNEHGHDGSGFAAVHVGLVENLAHACAEAGVERLLHVSALKANADRGPSHYLRTKGQAEELIRRLCGDDIKFTIFRPSVIFGPDDSFINRFAALLRRVPLLPVPQLGARFAPVYVEDVAAAIVKALEDSSTHNQTYELCGPDIYTLGEVLQFILRQLGIRRWVLPMPLLLARVQAWVADYLIPGKPFSLDNLRSLSVASVCSENGFAALGIDPTPMHAIVPSYLSQDLSRLAKLRQVTRR